MQSLDRLITATFLSRLGPDSLIRRQAGSYA